jgi:hypothetical protein
LEAWEGFGIGPYPHDAHLYWLVAEALMKEVPGANQNSFELFKAMVQSKLMQAAYVCFDFVRP